MHPDLDSLQGTWSVTALEMDGQSMPADMMGNARITIQGKRFTSTGMGAPYGGTLEINGSSGPRQLDMKFDSGPEKGNINRGIYELNGDTWKICLATRGEARPSAFVSPPGSGFALETLTRGEAAPPNVRASKKVRPEAQAGAPATEFEGEWSLVSAVMDGKPMDQSAVKWVKRVTRGRLTTVYAGPQVMLEVEFTHDPAQTPKAIDYLNTAGSNKGKKQAGIYEFEGDVLRFCVAAPGAARPGDFTPGKGLTLTVWKRG